MAVQTSRIEELIRMVIGGEPASRNLCHAVQADTKNEELLLDVEVDGARYLLVRLPKPTHGDVQLSPREQEIVRLIALGHSNKMIAGVLNISSWTVCTHLRRIFGKLGVGTRAAVVARLPEMASLRHLALEDEPIAKRRPTPVNDLVSSHR